jgi:hypothetical protein
MAQEPEITIEAGGRKVHTTMEELERAGRRLAFGEVGPEQEGYVLSDEVGNVARHLIRTEPRYSHIADMEVGYALQVGKKPEGKGGLHVLARAVKAPTLWASLGEWEVVVWANKLAWDHLSERQREALVAHELSHIGPRGESGKIAMLEHDIEEFAWVVRQYGQWHSGLEHFAEQLGLGLQQQRG